MPAAHQETIEWLDAVWNTLATSIKQANVQLLQNEAPHIHQEMSELIEELVGGFKLACEELKKLHPEAFIELNQWVLENGDLIGQLLQDKQEEIIPYKFLQYLFYAGQSFYLANDFTRGQLTFRLLTLLCPQTGDFYLWLGFCQQAQKRPLPALLSFSIAQVFLPENPFITFHMAECWMMLKRWDEMKTTLTACLEKVQDNPFLFPLKVKCSEELAILPSLMSGKVVTPSFTHFPLKISPKDGIQKAFLDGEEKFPPIPQNAKEEIEETLTILANSIDIERSGTFFSRHFIQKGAQGIVWEFIPFSESQRNAKLFFFGILFLGGKISAAHKFVAEVPAHAPVSVAYRLASFFENNDETIGETIVKYFYVCDAKRQLVTNQVMKNPNYGSSERPYEEDRDKADVRASRFFQKDLVGKSLLDFGCNEGFVLFACQKLGARSITGIDLSRRCIENANRMVEEKQIPNAQFLVGDMENSAFLSSLPQADTVFLLAILDTSYFVNKTAILSRVSQFAKDVLYYEGHLFTPSHVPKMYDLLVSTNFTRFEYLGTFERRPLIRCSREIFTQEQIPTGAVTSDASDAELLNASEIYLFTDSDKNPPFSIKCRLIQFVKR